MTQLSILLLDTEPCTSNGYITLAIEDALRRHPKVGRVVRAHHGNALRLFVDLGLDTFIAFGSARTHSAILERLAGLAGLSILWTTEDPYERTSNVAYSAWFDAVFTNDKSSVAAYGGRARHLPLAASPLFQNFGVQARNESYRYDLLFIGTAWPNRVRSLNRIMSAFAGRLKVKLALPWNSFIGPPELDDPTMLTDCDAATGTSPASPTGAASSSPCPGISPPHRTTRPQARPHPETVRDRAGGGLPTGGVARAGG